jgi:GNAT superfamily N-acetyltransferase
MADLIYQRHSGEQALAMLEEITDLYDEIHSEDPGGRPERFSRPNFIARTNNQARSAGFELVTATSQSSLIGYSFGYPFAPGVWWANCTPAPPEVLYAAKFGVIELDVRKEYRGRGIGKTLLGELLKDRDEKFATLASIPESPAHAMYIRWGWRKIGKFESSADAMLIELKT